MKKINIEVSAEELDVVLTALDMFKDEEESEQKTFVEVLINKLERNL